MIAEVHTVDCAAGMAAMPRGSVNLVVADPPYNIAVDYGDGRQADALAADEYAAAVRRWMAAAAGVLSPTGTLWIVCDAAYGATFDQAIAAAIGAVPVHPGPAR